RVIICSIFYFSGNPANEIVNLINTNRTAIKLPKLHDSPGLGCMALQYISECLGNCSNNNTVNCNPPEIDITEVYAPNCGVELPTLDTISGRLVACQQKYLQAEEPFLPILFRDKRTLSLLHSKEHTEVGVGFNRAHHGAFFWCVLFSSGRTNSTFVLESGSGIAQRSGCSSGANVQCSAGTKFLLIGPSVVITFSITLHYITAVIVF
ncbi:uncharacterized protein LOC109703701, partial [Ananas comosus]|uniref:Uncharacterized protein LOC109703701 n=1 Tax=Ananas comosus TaxID=4615 RepID=A0A6P5EAE2_ANACO